MLGARDLRAFCRPPMGVPVAFAGVSTYPDGQQVCGLFDRPIQIREAYQDGGGIQSAGSELRLPFDAFSPMPQSGDQVLVTDNGLTTTYEVDAPTAEDDGAFLVYELHGTGIAPVAALQASAENGQSIASDVLDAVVNQLGGNMAGAFRCRFRNFAPGELPCDNVMPETEDPTHEHTGQTEQHFRFFLRHMASGVGTEAEKLADRRFVRAQRQLFERPNLGGVVRSLRYEGRKWEIDNRESENVVCVAAYLAEFSTRPSDPSVAGF